MARMLQRRFRRLALILSGIGLGVDRGDWVIQGRALGCGYPKTDTALTSLRQQGVGFLVNLHARPHTPERLAAHGQAGVHIPVPDFHAPSPQQIEEAVTAIDDALDRGLAVGVHCGAGLGRTGTVLACYLAAHGATADEAIEKVRQSRPGSIETKEQEKAIRAYAASRRETS